MTKFLYRDSKVLEEVYWKKGLSTTRIAERFNTHNSVIRNWMIKHGIPRRPPKRIVPEKYKISRKILENLYIKKGLSIKEIAKEFGISYETIRQKLMKYNIHIRPKKPKEKYTISKKLLEKLYLKQKLSTRKIAKKLGIKDNKIIHARLVKYGIKRRSISEALTKYKKTPFSGNLEEKAYMIGLRAGDFFAYKSFHLVRIMGTTTKQNQLKMFRDVFNEYGHVHSFQNKRTKEWSIYCYLDNSFNFLVKKVDILPDWIMNNNSTFYSFLAGYSDCEGSWTITKDGKDAIRFTFTLANNDKPLLEQIKKKLEENGYTIHLRLRNRKGERTNLGIHTQNHYALVMNKKRDIVSLAKILTRVSHHKDKINKMKLIIENENKKWSEFLNK